MAVMFTLKQQQPEFQIKENVNPKPIYDIGFDADIDRGNIPGIYLSSYEPTPDLNYFLIPEYPDTSVMSEAYKDKLYINWNNYFRGLSKMTGQFERGDEANLYRHLIDTYPFLPSYAYTVDFEEFAVIRERASGARLAKSEFTGLVRQYQENSSKFNIYISHSVKLCVAVIPYVDTTLDEEEKLMIGNPLSSISVVYPVFPDGMPEWQKLEIEHMAMQSKAKLNKMEDYLSRNYISRMTNEVKKHTKKMDNIKE